VPGGLCKNGEKRGSDIVVDLMNAPINSQVNELEEFVEQSGIRKASIPDTARYTRAGADVSGRLQPTLPSACGRTPAFGASCSLPRVPAKVGLPKRDRLLIVVGGNASSW
jgi:hypothetical protein